MKAVVCSNAELRVVDRPEIIPSEGQCVLKVSRCGICGSDLHIRDHCDHLGKLYAQLGYTGFPRADEELVFGHEFCGEVLDYGPGSKKSIRPGTRVSVVPVIRRGAEIDGIGLSRGAPGAFAERVLVDELMMMPIPNGLPDDLAALTEPIAVAWHAVRRGEVTKRDVAVVIGCGPVGLAVICVLKALNVQTIIASDYSAGRRELARRCGANVIIDPAKESPYHDWKDHEFIGTIPELLDVSVGTRQTFGKLPLPWHYAWRFAEKAGLAPKRPVIFECVGAPGVLGSILDGAPFFSRVVVAGVCMQTDKIEPAMASNKEIELRFVFAYSPLEFRDALHMIAEGRIDCSPIVTGRVGLAGVDNAFAALRDPEKHAKILIDPSSMATTPVS
ncbi:zinc-binding dehydrogenase [Bradyrhizobium sp. WSM2254]|uniref:zinc-binding dehydrogenase n=1 Tax=Bradyrhizobium sp. WSM2254 TaxID=1188263 RepID=UPI000484800D|nr:zinc-binding dehydrogenase [Bradyrhizobium sp. WSM2254]